MQRFLLGMFIGWTCGAIYICLHEDKLYKQAMDEHATRIRAEIDRDLALGREATAKAELDTVRRNWMEARRRWWSPPDEGERIPAQADIPLVVVPKPEEMGIKLK